MNEIAMILAFGMFNYIKIFLMVMIPIIIIARLFGRKHSDF